MGQLRRVAVALNRKADLPVGLSWPPMLLPLIAVYGVYRQRNAHVVSALLDQLDDPLVALWALDEVAPSLAGLTVGSGPGAKFDLLNRLITSAPPGHRWALFTDDDYRVVRGDLSTFVARCDEARFDLAQPAHTPDSHWSHAMTVARPRAVARETRFVEIGPVFAVAPEASSRLLPFPADAGMGWGLDFEWSRTPDLRLGVVDHVRIKHLSPVGGNYDLAGELAGQEQRPPEDETARTTRSVGPLWRPWQQTPPWVTS